jgi:hypothetical protein
MATIGMAGTYRDKVKVAKAEIAAKLRQKLRECPYPGVLQKTLKLSSTTR